MRLSLAYFQFTDTFSTVGYPPDIRLTTPSTRLAESVLLPCSTLRTGNKIILYWIC
jgi:hypothetical protein